MSMLGVESNIRKVIIMHWLVEAMNFPPASVMKIIKPP